MTAKRFAIAVLSADGGEIAICPLPGRDGALDGDIAAIAAFAPTLVVSMTEEDEMRWSGAGELAALLAARGIGWRHFPIVDYGAPEETDIRWPPLAAEIHAALDAGHRVLLHCHGGKGRSGMIALRLLVERGMDAAEALALVRAARPGAVETVAQEAWGSAKTSPAGATPLSPLNRPIS
jgi:protein-tyrosine phosphatase